MKIINHLIFALISLSLIGWFNKPKQQDPVPIHDNFRIESKKVEETRTINVWIPPAYKKSTDSFPVLYMPDGGIKEDFPHIANTIAKLIETKRIPPIILVGIENTDRRRDLTGFSDDKEDQKIAPLSDGAKNFRAFIKDELIVEINNRYRASDKKGIVGESAAGLFVVETFLLNPELVDFYIAMDPALWWNNHYLVRIAKKQLANFQNKELKIWFAGSNTKDISPHTNKLAEVLKSDAPKSLHWRYSDEPNEKHNSIFRATKEKALIWTLN